MDKKHEKTILELIKAGIFSLGTLSMIQGLTTFEKDKFWGIIIILFGYACVYLAVNKLG